MLKRLKLSSMVLLLLAMPIGAASAPFVMAADQATTTPSTSPSAEAIDKANDVLTAGSDDLHAGKPEKALDEFRSAAALFEKAYGTQQVDEVGICLNGEALSLDQLDRSSDALPLYQKGLEILRHVHNKEDDDDLAAALANTSFCLRKLDRDTEALPLAREALEMRQRLAKGQDDPDVLWSANNVGILLFRLGENDKALPFFRLALEMNRRLHKGEDDPEVATDIENVAKCLSNLERYAEALPLEREALAMRQRLSKGQDDSDVAWGMGQVGMCLINLGRDDEALPLLQSALEMNRHLYKDQDDSEVAKSLFSLASCLDDLGRQTDALADYRAAYEMKARLAKGEDSPDLATTENCVGITLFSLGRYDEALPVFKAALEMRQRLYKDEDDTNVVSSLNNVAKCLDTLGRSAEALKVYQLALDMTRRIYKNRDSTDLATLMDNVAACMDSLGQGVDALPMFQAALEMKQRLYKGQDSIDVATSLNNLATCLGFLGHTQEALDKLQSARDMLERIHKGQDSPDVAKALDNIATALDNLGRSAEALSNVEAALEMQRRIYNGQDHPDVADSLTKISYCYTSLGRYDEALATQQSALEMWKRVYKNQDHPDIAEAMSSVGICLDNLERVPESIPMFEDALAMRRRLFKNQDHPSIALNLVFLAGALQTLERSNEALPFYREALKMQNRIYRNRDHPNIALNLEKMAMCLFNLDRNEEALEHCQAAVAMAKRIDDPRQSEYECKLGDCFRSVGKLTDAAVAYDESIAAFDRARAASGGDDQDRMKKMEAWDVGDAFPAMFTLQLELKNPAKAAEYLDRGRARSLLDVLERAERDTGTDFLAPIEAKAQSNHDEKLLGQIKQARNTLSAADREVQQLTSQINYVRSINDAASYAQIDQLKPKLDEACDEYYEAHRRAFNLAGSTSYSQAIPASQMQPFLKPHQHLLMYAIFRNDPVLIVIPPAGETITAVHLTVPNSDEAMPGIALEKLIIKYTRDLIAHRQNFVRGAKLVHDNSVTPATDDLTQDGYELFRGLMPAEIWEQIKNDDLVYIVPDPVMNGLPLETLIVQKPITVSAKDCLYWLDEGPAICYGPSAAALIKLCSEQKGDSPKTFTHQAVLLGDPVLQRETADSSSPTTQPAAETRNASLSAYGPLSPLPGTRKEVMGIYEALTGKTYSDRHDDSVVVLLGEDATGHRLADAAAGARYLHLATHGLARSGRDAIYSSVVLTQPRSINSGDTGLLTLEDLFDRWGGKLRGTELVVLSACDSQGIDESGENALSDDGVYGLPWGFWYAGSPAVVASLWEVQDDSTAKLMEQFYRDLQSQSSKTKLAAFTAARKELKKEYPEPYFWAPFIYLGNPN